MEVIVQKSFVDKNTNKRLHPGEQIVVDEDRCKELVEAGNYVKPVDEPKKDEEAVDESKADEEAVDESKADEEPADEPKKDEEAVDEPKADEKPAKKNKSK